MAPAVKGLAQVLAALKRESEKIKGATAAAVYQKGLAIIGQAKKYTPVDTGRLRATGYAAPPKSIDNPVVEIGFGTKYGLAVHERVEVPHEVGRSLYLKTAVDEHRSGYVKWIKDQAWRNYNRGVGITTVPSEGIPKTRKDDAGKGK